MMNYKQKIVFDFNGAILTILADFDRNIAENQDDVKILTFTSTPISYSHMFDENNVKINFHNILESENLDDHTPIQYLPSNEFINLFC